MKPEEHGRRWRERRVAQSRRDVELETFPTTAGSRALLSHPMFGAGRGQSPAQFPTEVGETLTVKAVSVAVGTTPSVVTFTATVGENAGFAQVELPTDELMPSYPDSYYDVQVELVRGAFGGTVAVEVLRGDTVIWGPTMSPYWSNPQVPVSAKGRLTGEA